jgi:hypothetical protein
MAVHIRVKPDRKRLKTQALRAAASSPAKT